jgi:hypothetical protein
MSLTRSLLVMEVNDHIADRESVSRRQKPLEEEPSLGQYLAGETRPAAIRLRFY